MGRVPRPFMPGGIFHLSARTIRAERRFTPRLRTAALGAIAGALPRSGSRLLAVAIMSNHFHLVVQQGKRDLSKLMQPLLRRLALMLQKAHGFEGPVFWRPYGSWVCMNPAHARNSIAYSHLNPVRAHLCADPAEYPWTSHALYADRWRKAIPPELEPIVPVLDPSLALPLFATSPDRSAARLQTDYLAFLRRRLGQGDDDAPPTGDPTDDPAPPAAWAGEDWGDSLTPLFHSPIRRGDLTWPDGPGAVPDLATAARIALQLEAPGVSLDTIRGRGGGHRMTRLRHAVIRRVSAAGHRNVDIAHFLGISESAVSYVLCGGWKSGK